MYYLNPRWLRQNLLMQFVSKCIVTDRLFKKVISGKILYFEYSS